MTRTATSEFDTLCPECSAEPVFVHVHKEHYGTCPAHRVAWYAGYNLFTTYTRWDDEDVIGIYGHADRDRIAADARAELATYRMLDGAQP